jgi:hypothetical protein
MRSIKPPDKAALQTTFISDHFFRFEGKEDIQDFLSLCVACGLTLALTVLLIGLGSLVRCSSSDELMRERGLVRCVNDLAAKRRLD